jgi:DNA-binding transcriptional MerR regulator
MGRAPYGWKWGTEGKLVAVDDELQTLRRMQQLRATGLSYAAIAAALNDDDVPTKRNGTWKGMTIQRILRRSRETLADETTSK